MISNVRVLIIGGGVAGLSAANALASRGIASSILEQRRQYGGIDRGDVLHGQVLPLLSSWRFFEHASPSHISTLSTFQVCNSHGHALLGVDLRSIVGRDDPLLLIRHHRLEEALSACAVASGRVTIMNGSRARRLLRQNGRVTGAALEDGNEINAELTIISTGAQSPIAADAMPLGHVLNYRCSFANVLIDAIQDVPHIGRYFLSRHGTMIMVPLPEGYLRVGFQVESEQQIRDLRSNHMLGKAIQSRFLTFPSESVRLREFSVYRVARRVAPHFWVPGAVLVGDAAHTVHPAGGLGMTLAIQDAECLAREWSAVFHSGRREEEAAGVYEAARRQAAERVASRTHALGAASEWRGKASWLLRRVGLRVCGRLQFVTDMIVRRLLETE